MLNIPDGGHIIKGWMKRDAWKDVGYSFIFNFTIKRLELPWKPKICNQNHQNGSNITHNMTFRSLGGGHIGKGHKKGVTGGKVGHLTFGIKLTPNDPKYAIKSTFTVQSQFCSHCL